MRPYPCHRKGFGPIFNANSSISLLSVVFNARRPNVFSMDESKLQAVSGGDSIYISLMDLRNAEIEGLRSPRRTVSLQKQLRTQFYIDILHPVRDDLIAFALYNPAL
jgi:hypothetical protein